MSASWSMGPLSREDLGPAVASDEPAAPTTLAAFGAPLRGGRTPREAGSERFRLGLERPELLLLCNDSLPKSMVSTCFLWSNAKSSVRLTSNPVSPAVLLSVQPGGGLMKDST